MSEQLQSSNAKPARVSSSTTSIFDAIDGVLPPINGQSWPAEKEKILLGPYRYMCDQPGKGVRKQFIAAFDMWLKVPESSLAIITNVVEMLHMASLLVDDVEDSSQLRRGVPVAHNIFGTAQTINSANYVYFQALQELLKIDNPALANIYADELINLHRGQGMDIFWRDSLRCPTEADYLEMASNKTGGLFRLAVRLMQAESNVDKDLLPLVDIIGVLFQVRDDYLNLSHEYTSKKGLCEDLTEGKFSFPIVHAVRSNPQDLRLINILKQRTENEDIKRHAVKYLQDMGSIDYAKKTIGILKKCAVSLLDQLDDGSGAANRVKTLLDKMNVQ